MFSTRRQLFGTGLNIAKNLRSSGISKTAATRKLACSYFSVKVEEKIAPPPVQEKVLPQPQTLSPDEKIRGLSNNISVSFDIRRRDDGAYMLLHMLKELSKSHIRDPNKAVEICGQIMNSDPYFSIKEYVDILYCLSSLNIHDEDLLLRVLNKINSLMKHIYKPSPFITCISKSMRNLQIRKTDTLDMLIQWFNSRETNFDMSNAATDLVQTLAVLNYFPAGADVFLQKILKSELVEYSNSTKYLNFVWAVTLLDRLQSPMAECVLNTGFRKKLESILDFEFRNGAYRKLVNIHAYSNLRKFKVTMDSHWFSSEFPWLDKLQQRRRRDPVIRNFIDALANLLPVRTFNTFIKSSCGCIIDAVCFFDEREKPTTELEFTKNKGGVRLAIIVLSYKDLCLPGKTIPIGIIEFHKRMLQESNYKVLLLPFNELPAQAKLESKCAILKEKIRTVLPGYGDTK